MSKSDLREMVDAWATELGANYEMRKKWRQRRIPPEWRLRLIERAQADGISLRSRDFDRLYGT